MNYEWIKDNNKHFFRSPTFKVLYIVAIVISFSILYGNKQNLPQLSNIQLLLSLLMNGTFLFFGIFLIPLVATLYTYFRFEKYTSYIIRLQTKKQYLKSLLQTAFAINTCIFGIIIMTCLILLNIFSFDLSIQILSNYLISDGLYAIYTIIRLYILSQILMIMNVLLCKIISPKWVTFLNIILYILTVSEIFTPSKISDISQMSFWIGSYMIPGLYDSFLVEVSCTTLFLIVLILFAVALKWWVIKTMEQIGD